MAMVTVEQFREYYEQLPAGLAIDTKIGHAIDRAEDIVVKALGFTFEADGFVWSSVAASQKRVQSEKSKHLKLPPYLYGSITSLVTMVGSGSTATIGTSEVADYEETRDQFYLYRSAGWGGVRYAVTAKWGYGAAPASIVELILELAVNIWRQKAQGLFQQVMGVNTSATTGTNTGGGSLKYVGGLNADQRKIVANVRRQYIEGVH